MNGDATEGAVRAGQQARARKNRQRSIFSGLYLRPLAGYGAGQRPAPGSPQVVNGTTAGIDWMAPEC